MTISMQSDAINKILMDMPEGVITTRELLSALHRAYQAGWQDCSGLVSVYLADSEKARELAQRPHDFGDII